MAVRIAFLNFKGGVGKTAAAVNLAAILAKYHQKRVLLVDLDAQANSSLWLLRPDFWADHTTNGIRSTYQIFQDHIAGTKFFDFDDAVIKGVPRANFPLIASLDLLPAVTELIDVEDRIYENKYVPFFRSVYSSLKPYFRNYDYIFFDCPPNIYAVTKSALFASQYCVVPYLPDYLSLSGLRTMSKLVRRFFEQVRGELPEKHIPSIAALIMSHMRQGNAFAQAVNELKFQVSKLKQDGLVHPAIELLSPEIRHSVDVADSTNYHLPVILHRPNSIGAIDYANLGENFVVHFERNL